MPSIEGNDLIRNWWQSHFEGNDRQEMIINVKRGIWKQLRNRIKKTL